MIWLLTEIAVLVVSAAVVGTLAGWLLGRSIERRRRAADNRRHGAELDLVTRRGEEVAVANEELTRRLASVAGERDDLGRRCDELRTALDDERRELTDQLAAAAWRSDSSLRPQLAEARAELDTAVEQLEAARGELTTTRRVLAERTEQLSSLRHELAECSARNEELVEETDELRLGPLPAMGPAGAAGEHLERAVADLEARARRHDELLQQLQASAPDIAGTHGEELTALHERLAALESAVDDRKVVMERLSAALGLSTGDDADDLTRLPGVDDRLAAALAARGFTRYKHLARLAPRDLDEVLAGTEGAAELDSARVVQRATRLHRAARAARAAEPAGDTEPGGG